MEHLKAYESFINGIKQTETILTLKDICLELEDEGFSIHFNKASYRIRLSICKYDESSLVDFYWKEVDDVVNRIINYLSDRLVGMTYLKSGGGNFKRIDPKRNPQPTMDLYDLVIEFSN